MFLSWPKLGLEPKFQETGTFGGFGKRAQSVSYIQLMLTLDHISKIGLLRHVLSWPELGLEPKYHDPGTFGDTHNHDTIPKCYIFEMAAATIFDTDLFVKGGAWHHTYLIMKGSEEL